MASALRSITIAWKKNGDQKKNAPGVSGNKVTRADAKEAGDGCMGKRRTLRAVVIMLASRETIKEIIAKVKMMRSKRVGAGLQHW